MDRPVTEDGDRFTPRPGSIRHPLNPNAYYCDNGDGTVRVTMGTRWGRFAPDGRHVEGTLFEADPEMCVWVAAPRPSNHHRISRLLDMPAERQVRPADTAAAAEAIRQAALRYCRGVDRLDAGLMLSAYHDGATDDHGVFAGSAADLCARVVQSHRRYQATMHCVLNHAIEVVDDTHAIGEIYNVTYLVRAADCGRQLDTWWGRYLDDYECRDGRWAIAHRTCVHEWTRTEPLGAAMPIEAQLFRQGHEDRGAQKARRSPGST